MEVRGCPKQPLTRYSHAKGKTQLLIDQSAKPTIDNLWSPIGRFSFGRERSAAVSAEVSLSDKGTEGYLIADAVQFVHVDDLENKEDLSTTYLEESSTAIFRGAYTPFYYGFDDYKAPVRGNYRIRIKAKSVIRQTDYVDWEETRNHASTPILSSMPRGAIQLLLTTAFFPANVVSPSRSTPRPCMNPIPRACCPSVPSKHHRANLKSLN